MKLNGLLLNENQIEHMKKITTFLLIIGMMLPGLTTQADEGMWIVNMLNRITMAEMQGMGLNLTAEEIYDINNASLKDAIVRLSTIGFIVISINKGTDDVTTSEM